MTRPLDTPTRPQTRIVAHTAPAVVLALLLLAVVLLAVVPGGERVAIPQASSTACEPGALTLHAHLDEYRLGQGGPGGGIARLRLEVTGTEAPVRIELINRTPGVVGLEGGNVQVARSTGGADNRLEREVLTHRAGDLEILYRFADSPCSGL